MRLMANALMFAYVAALKRTGGGMKTKQKHYETLRYAFLTHITSGVTS